MRKTILFVICMLALVAVSVQAHIGPSINSITLDEADEYYSPCAGNDVINFNADVSFATIVLANLSSVYPGIDCGSGPVVALTNTGGNMWEGSCDVANEAQYSNFQGGAVVIIASDGSFTDVRTKDVILYNMTSPTPFTPCERDGEDATNFCRVDNFRSIDYTVDVETYGSAACNGGQQLPWGDNWKEVVKMEFSGLDFTDNETISNLPNLATAITPYITPPGMYGDSYISVNSSAFAVLNTTAVISIYGLPFAYVPEILGPTSAYDVDFVINEPYQISITYDCSIDLSGFQNCIDDCEDELCEEDCANEYVFGNVNDYWTCIDDCDGSGICENACDEAYVYDACVEALGGETLTFNQAVPNSDITFTVDSFSQYNMTDDVDPTVEILAPENSDSKVPNDYILNITVNGTGSQVSKIVITNENGEQTEIQYSAIPFNCMNLSANWDAWSCAWYYNNQSDGYHNFTVEVYDFGGESGNSASASTEFTVNLTCGSELTSNATLTHDISECGGSALSIAKDNVTFDCNGHTISGLGIGTGVDVKDVSGVKIKNCNIDRFQTGINVSNSADDLIQNSNITENGVVISDFSGVHFANVSDSTIRDSKIKANDFGVVMVDSDNNTVLDSEIANNTNIGVLLESSSNNTIEGGAIYGNNNPTQSSSYGGIVVSDSSDDNTITGVYMHNNKNAAIYAHGFTGLTIEENNIDSNCGGNAGIYMYSAGDAVIQNNNVTNGTGYGIALVGSCTGAEVINNTISGNTYHGLWVYSSSGVVVRGNTFIDNGVGFSNILFENSDSPVVDDNTIEGTQYGVHFSEISNGNITNNEISDFRNTGIKLYSAGTASNNLLKDNTINNTYGESESVYGMYIQDDNNDIVDNTIVCADASDASYVGIYVYNNAGNADYNTFSGNEISRCYWGVTVDSVANATFENENYHNNYCAIYASSAGDSVVIRDSDLYDNEEGVRASSSSLIIENTDFTNNKGMVGRTGLYMVNSDVNLLNGNFEGNGQYGIYEERGTTVYWTISDEITCKDNNMTFAGDVPVFEGGKLILDNCSIFINGDLWNVSSGIEGYDEFTMTVTEGTNTTTGSESDGFEVTANGNSDQTLALTVQKYEDNPAGSGYSLRPLGLFYGFETDSPLDVAWMIIKVYYNDSDLGGLTESSLRLEYYNETSGEWTIYNPPLGGVNVDDNYVWANVTHFSTWGVFGSRSSGGGGGSGVDSVLSETILTLTQDTQTFSLVKDDVVHFKLNGEPHTITLNTIGSIFVIAIVASDPQSLQVNVGDTRQVDVNNDGVNDLAITLNSVASSKASLTFSLLTQPAAVSETPATTTTLPETKAPTGAATTGQPDLQKSGSSYLMWIVVIAVVLVIVIAAIVSAKRRE
jgi:parallel beta-helix repeat protein